MNPQYYDDRRKDCTTVFFSCQSTKLLKDLFLPILLYSRINFYGDNWVRSQGDVTDMARSQRSSSYSFTFSNVDYPLCCAKITNSRLLLAWMLAS